jgi:hypothetical protein
MMLRRFESKIAKFTVQLNPLTSGATGRKFEWTKEHDQVLAKLKDLLRSMLKNPRNFRPDPVLPLIVEVDASNFALGAALIQEVSSGYEVKEEDDLERRLIYAASRSLNSAEINYSTIRRELKGISFALNKFRKFLQGRKFLVRTDHLPLKGVFSKGLHAIENTKIREEVADLVAEFDFELEYRPGKDNLLPDYLSRNCLDELYEYSEFKEDGGVMFVRQRDKWFRFLPARERRGFLLSIHTNRHYGQTRMLESVKEAAVTWPRLKEDVQEFLTYCLCAVSKQNRRRNKGWVIPRS